MNLGCALAWLYSKHGIGGKELAEKITVSGQLTDQEYASAYELIMKNGGLFKDAGIDTSGIPPYRQVITLEDVVETERVGNKEKVRFSPTFAAKAVLKTMCTAMTKDSDEIYYFNGQIYNPDGARIIDRALCNAAGDIFTDYQKRETLRRIKIDLLEHSIKFDPNPYLLGLKNGVVNLLTGEFREYRAEDLITDQIPVVFDANATCPAFLAFLQSITPVESDRETLIDWFAIHAIKEPFPYVMFLLGLGRNGKGIYERLMKAFYGKSAFRDMPLSEVHKNNFATGYFYRKRGWIASETGNKKTSIGTDFMKLTSGDGTIDSDRKNKDRLEYDPYFRTTVDTNIMPRIDDNSIGWKERFIKINLPYIFVAEPDSDNPLEKKRDPNLFEKLTTPGELSGILNLLISRTKTIGQSKTIRKRSGTTMFSEYNEQSNSMTSFLNQFCEVVTEGNDFWTPSKPIYDAYAEWCKYTVSEVVDAAPFGKQLKKFCGGIEPKRGKDKNRKSTTEYSRLNFDIGRYNAVLEEMKKSVA